jgi:hypothetical protein
MKPPLRKKEKEERKKGRARQGMWLMKGILEIK